MDLTTALTVPAEARLPSRVAVVGAGRLWTAPCAAFAGARRLAAQRMVAA
jgi:hypothetical protein